jgi:hypothetical protein
VLVTRNGIAPACPPTAAVTTAVPTPTAVTVTLKAGPAVDSDRTAGLLTDDKGANPAGSWPAPFRPGIIPTLAFRLSDLSRLNSLVRFF